MANSTQQAINLALESIAKIEEKANSLHESLIGSAKELNSMLSKDITSFKQLGDTVEKVNKETNTFKIKQNELAKTYQSLEKQKQKQIKANLKEADAIERNKKALQRQKEASLELNRAYVKLVNAQKQAKKQLQDAIVLHGKNSRQVKIAQKEYNKLTAKVNQANKATSNFSKTGLGSMARGFKNLLGAFGIIGGLTIFADMTKKGFNLARQLDSLNFTMKSVISNTETLERTQLFLANTAEKYGASILTLTERYNKFYTAARQSGVELEDTENIFKSFTKSAGFLGLRSHELEGVFLALEQMLSKGKVTTEELRRQLGERLPGAFGVMADTVNKLNPDIEVTVEVLDDMLKKGQILSHEVLPEFAKQYEKSIGVEQKDRVETLNASIERMTNSWVDFIGSVTKSDGVISKVLIKSIDLVTSFIETLNLLNQTEEEFGKVLENKIFTSQLKYYKELGDAAIKDAEYKKKNAEQNIKSLEKEIAFNEKLVKLYSTNYPEYYKLYRKHNKDTTQARQENEKLNHTLSTQKGILRAATFILNDKKEVTKKEIKEGRTLSDVLNDISKAQKELSESTKEQAPEILKKIDNLNKEKKAWELVKKAIEKTKSLEKGKGLDLSMVQKTNELSNYQKELINVLETYKKTEDAPELMPLSDETQERLEKFNKELVKTIIKLSELEDAKAVFSTLTETFADVFDINISKFDFLFDEAKNTVSDWAELSKELIGSVLDASLQRYEIELQVAQRTRDRILNDEFATEEQKAAARRQFEEEERRIKTEQAKKERENTLIKIAVDTAAAIMALPATGGLLGLAAIPAVIALGALQAGIVASQPLPQFYDGVENSTYEGLATKDEQGAELHLDKSGKIKDLGQNKGAKLTHIAKGDTIIPAPQTKSILDSINANELQRAVFDMNMISNGRILSENVVDRSLLNEVGGLRKDIDVMGKRIEKIASRPINNNVKVELKNEKAY